MIPETTVIYRPVTPEAAELYAALVDDLLDEGWTLPWRIEIVTTLAPPIDVLGVL